jgi:glycosyltransferase involved in cell wall biosynthesis
MIHYSVLIPCRNATDVVERLLVDLRYTLVGLLLPYEIICVDDGLSPSDAATLERQCAAHPHTRLLRFEQSRGTSAALGAGMMAARGDLIIAIGPGAQVSVRHLPHLVARLSQSDLVIAERDRSLGGKLADSAVRACRLFAADPESGAGEEFFWAARREAVAGLHLARGAFRVLPALVARRRFRVSRLTLSEGLPARGQMLRLGLLDRMAAAWFAERFEPHLARERTTGSQPELAIERGDLPRRVIPTTTNSAFERQHHETT